MKWQDVCILNFNPADPVITRSATLWRQRYGIPDDRCFAAGTLAGWTPANIGCMSFCTLNTKLIIFAHADEDLIHVVVGQNPTNAGIDMDPVTFGERLYHYMGLRQVGLISFKACRVGARRFLPDLATYLGNRGAQVGWLIGYKGLTRTGPADGYPGIARELVRLPQLGPLEYQDFHAWDAGEKLSDDWRVKVVKGNAWRQCRIEGSRRYGG